MKAVTSSIKFYSNSLPLSQVKMFSQFAPTPQEIANHFGKPVWTAMLPHFVALNPLYCRSWMSQLICNTNSIIYIDLNQCPQLVLSLIESAFHQKQLRAKLFVYSYYSPRKINIPLYELDS